jgi:hypothetical protein
VILQHGWLRELLRRSPTRRLRRRRGTHDPAWRRFWARAPDAISSIGIRASAALCRSVCTGNTAYLAVPTRSGCSMNGWDMGATTT